MRSGGGDGDAKGGDAKEVDEEDDDAATGPQRRRSILQALPQLFGGWRGDKTRKSGKAKSFKGVQSVGDDDDNSGKSPHLPDLNVPRRASASHHDLMPGLLHLHLPSSKGSSSMKNSESDPNLKLMAKRGVSSSSLQVPSSPGGAGAGGGAAILSRQPSLRGSVAAKSLRVIDGRLQDKSESIDEHLSIAEAMIAKQQGLASPTTASAVGPGMLTKQASISKLPASSRANTTVYQ